MLSMVAHEANPTAATGELAAQPVTGPRAPGWLAILLLVAGGMSIGAVVFRLRAPGLVAAWRERRAALPEDPGARLDAWLAFGAPMIRERLSALRSSAREPWLVAATADGPEGAGEWWGIDLAAWPAPWARREGLVVVVELPALRRLKPAATSVAGPAPDLERMRGEMQALVERSLRHPGDLAGGLGRDIAGASLEVRMQPQETR
jgi:hypothetical protein